MTGMQHFINGIEIKPVDAQNIGIKLDFLGDAKEAELNVDSIILTNDAYSEVMNHIDNGVGLFEGIPYTVKIGSITIEYGLDLSSATFSDSQVELQIKRRKSIDWFMEQARGLSFESLNAKQTITGAFNVPYIIVKDNQVELLIMLAITGFNTTVSLIQGIKDLVVVISAPTVQASTPNAGVPPSMDTGDIIALVLKIAAQAIYIAALIVALIKIIQEMVELIVPKVRNLNGNTVKSLISQGCSYLGFNFVSTMLDSEQGLSVVPVPLVAENKSIWDVLLNNQTQAFNKKYPSAMDTVSTLGALIDAIKQRNNGKLRIIGNTVYLERRDHWYNQSSGVVLATLNLQDKRENSHTYNFNECWKRAYVHYQFDQSDSHTIDKIQGIQAEYSTEPIATNNADLINIKGLYEINIPFALGYRKSKLTKVEEALEDLAKVVDDIVQFFGGSSNLVAQINARIGVMQISQQHFTVTKLMYLVGGKQPTNFVDLIGCTALWNKYHAINQVKENFKRIEESDIPFSETQLEQLLLNNVVFDTDGNQLEILNFEYINDAAKASIECTYASDKASNLKTVKIL
jgi:hypothetical protein